MMHYKGAICRWRPTTMLAGCARESFYDLMKAYSEYY
jgi:hypothetical protein